MCSGVIVPQAAEAAPGNRTEGAFDPLAAPGAPSAQPGKVKHTKRHADTVGAIFRMNLGITPGAIPCIDRYLPNQAVQSSNLFFLKV
jgi:hypothetical protein